MRGANAPPRPLNSSNSRSELIVTKCRSVKLENASRLRSYRSETEKQIDRETIEKFIVMASSSSFSVHWPSPANGIDAWFILLLPSLHFAPLLHLSINSVRWQIAPSFDVSSIMPIWNGFSNVRCCCCLFLFDPKNDSETFFSGPLCLDRFDQPRE